MKKLLIGIVLGAVVTGGIANYATLQYEKQVERYRNQVIELGNEIAHLEFTNRQLMNENSQLSEQIK